MRRLIRNILFDGCWEFLVRDWTYAVDVECSSTRGSQSTPMVERTMITGFDFWLSPMNKSHPLILIFHTFVSFQTEHIEAQTSKQKDWQSRWCGSLGRISEPRKIYRLMRRSGHKAQQHQAENFVNHFGPSAITIYAAASCTFEKFSTFSDTWRESWCHLADHGESWANNRFF